MSLTEKDFHDIKRAKAIIEHVRDGEKKMSFGEVLDLLEWCLIMMQGIFFNKEGKPKSKLQLIFALPAIIGFVSKLIRRINDGKPARIKARTPEQAVHDAIIKARKDAR